MAGIIAGRTNNNIGLASIGYKCMISDAPQGDQNVLKLSKDGLRIVNCSWSNWAKDTLDFTGVADWVDLYNEVYENGASAIFAAGNDGLPGENGRATDYNFPASYEHNISVSSVGHLKDPILPYNIANHEVNVKDYHQSYFANSGTYGTMNHNSRVDICAPGFTVKSTAVNRHIINNVYIGLNYDSVFTGSSCSAPFVSGTVGLMLHARSCLSPYQVEYILKKTAKNLYTIPANLPYIGQLGAGRLDAGQAVDSAKRYNCNNPATSTMYIDGIDINTRCAPGHSTPAGRNPVLKPRIVNGVPPYTYRWVGISGNNTGLNNYTAAAPAITSSYGSHLAYYLLTVTDGSPVPKVASIRVKLQLILNGWDLAMRDSYFDMLDEPNSQGNVDLRNSSYIWASPDLWNRKKKDGITTPENVEYFSSGDSNYMYVRVRNVGCTASPVGGFTSPRVKLYWTLASTGEKWDVDWINRNVPASGGGTVPGGREITPLTTGILLPSIQPGDSVIVVQGWKPQNPKTYVNQPDSVQACALARIETDYAPQFGMATRESFNVSISANVRKNNNIVTRNMMMANLNRMHPKVIYNPYVRNVDSFARNFSLRLITDKDIYKHYAGNLSDYVYATVYLGDVLYARWRSGGSLGLSGIADDSAKTITYDPASPLRLDNIYMAPDESFQLAITFSLRDSVFIEYPISADVHLRQLVYDTEVENPEIYGNVSYNLNIEADEESKEHQERKVLPAIATLNNDYTLYPNPVSGTLTARYNGTDKTVTEFVLTDITGKVIMRKSNIVLLPGATCPVKMSSLPPGNYLLHITDSRGTASVQKITKE